MQQPAPLRSWAAEAIAARFADGGWPLTLAPVVRDFIQGAATLDDVLHHWDPRLPTAAWGMTVDVQPTGQITALDAPLDGTDKAVLDLYLLDLQTRPQASEQITRSLYRFLGLILRAGPVKTVVAQMDSHGLSKRDAHTLLLDAYALAVRGCRFDGTYRRPYDSKDVLGEIPHPLAVTGRCLEDGVFAVDSVDFIKECRWPLAADAYLLDLILHDSPFITSLLRQYRGHTSRWHWMPHTWIESLVTLPLRRLGRADLCFALVNDPEVEHDPAFKDVLFHDLLFMVAHEITQRGRLDLLDDAWRVVRQTPTWACIDVVLRLAAIDPERAVPWLIEVVRAKEYKYHDAYAWLDKHGFLPDDLRVVTGPPSLPSPAAPPEAPPSGLFAEAPADPGVVWADGRPLTSDEEAVLVPAALREGSDFVALAFRTARIVLESHPEWTESRGGDWPVSPAPFEALGEALEAATADLLFVPDLRSLEPLRRVFRPCGSATLTAPDVLDIVVWGKAPGDLETGEPLSYHAETTGFLAPPHALSTKLSYVENGMEAYYIPVSERDDFFGYVLDPRFAPAVFLDYDMKYGSVSTYIGPDTSALLPDLAVRYGDTFAGAKEQYEEASVRLQRYPPGTVAPLPQPLSGDGDEDSPPLQAPTPPEPWGIVRPNPAVPGAMGEAHEDLTRVVDFGTDEAAGVLYTRGAGEADWTFLGHARGQVEISVGGEVALWVTEAGIHHIRSLAQLPPGLVTHLSLAGAGLRNNPYHERHPSPPIVPGAVAETLSHLGGLHVLDLQASSVQPGELQDVLGVLGRAGLESLSGYAPWPVQAPGRTLSHADLARVRDWPENFPHLRALRLAETLDANLFAPLVRLPALEAIDLSASFVTACDFAVLAAAPRLRALRLRGVSAFERGRATGLDKVRMLHTLDLSWTSPPLLTQLVPMAARLPALRTLVLDGAPTEEAKAVLALYLGDQGFPSLKRLSLRHVALTPILEGRLAQAAERLNVVRH